MSSIRWTIAFTAALLILTACNPAASEPTSTPTLDPAPTWEAQTQAAEAAQSTADAESTAVAQQTADVEATAEAQATTDAESTSVAAATGTREAINANSTSSAEETQTANTTATAIAVAQSTAMADTFFETVQGLYDGGIISSTGGEYVRFFDFNQSWAQLGWYRFFPTGISEKNFVLRTDASWRSASDKADWWTSGCGFVFREDEEINHYVTYLGLDGRVYLGRVINDAFQMLGSSYYGPVGTPDGDAEIMLVVEDENIFVFVNGERVIFRQDRAHESGNLHFTLVSGTNKDYGTQCKMEDIDIWFLSEDT
ncbi:MAG: hypothetical protein R3335_11250 [Anaerolineales bacterium]|nr:hypothetical protein [Anaerolineales bacterium]